MTVDFNEAGANIGKRLAVVVDGKVLSAPTIRTVIHDKALITGKVTAAEAGAIVQALNSKEQAQPLAPAGHR